MPARPGASAALFPAPPELADLLKQHVATFGLGEGGRLFRGSRSPDLPKITYIRAWQAARAIAFTPEVAVFPPRRNAVLLAARVRVDVAQRWRPADQMAEWAGHSVEVLLKIYAKRLDGQDHEARRRVLGALGVRTTLPNDVDTH